MNCALCVHIRNELCLCPKIGNLFGRLVWRAKASNKDQVEFPMEKIEMIAGPNKFQVDFHPLDLTKASNCQFALLATKVSVGFEECLGQETCLRIFGDGSAAGFAMRNVNKHQETVFESGLASHATCDPNSPSPSMTCRWGCCSQKKKKTSQQYQSQSQ